MGITRALSSGQAPWRLSAFESSGTLARISYTITQTGAICVLQGIDFAESTGATNTLEVTASTADGGVFYADFNTTGAGITAFQWRGYMVLNRAALFVAFAQSTVDCDIGVTAWGVMLNQGGLTYPP